MRKLAGVTGTTGISLVADTAGGVSAAQQEEQALPSQGASFSDLKALTIDGVLGRLSELGVPHQLGRSGMEATITIEDGLHESGDDRMARVIAGLGLPPPGLVDPRLGRSPNRYTIGNGTVILDFSQTRNLPLLELARRAARKEDLDLAQVAATGLQGSFGGMIRKRGLEVHCRDLGARFQDFLTRSDGETRLLVLGSGECRMEKELLSGEFERLPRSDFPRHIAARPLEQKPSIISVDLGQAPADLSSPKHLHRSGFFSAVDIPGGDGSIDAIVDMIGCFTYTPTLSKDLQRGVRLLREGGEMFIGTTDALVIYQNDRLMLLPEWLQTIPGLEVEFNKPGETTDGAYLFFSVKKTRPEVTIPDLDLIFQQAHYPRALSHVHIFAPQ